MKLKPINEQTIVITGATSGIGLTTARMAFKQGAKLVLNARNEDALDQLLDELDDGKDRIIAISGDVAFETEVKKVAQGAIDKFGGFDTWVNNAGVSIYGKLEDVSLPDSKQLFETNFWGTVNGSIAAAQHLKTHAGAIINIGSTLSDRAIPIQGMYSASKHAVKGFTDALRMELEAESAPISVTLIKPGAIDTPYKEHAKNYMPVQPENPPPVYAPEIVATAILYSATTPTRDLFIGSGGKLISALGTVAPRTADAIMSSSMVEMQQTDKPPTDEFEGLYTSTDPRLRSRGDYEGHVAETSIYTSAAMHPVITASLIGLGLGSLIYGLSTTFRSNEI